MSQVNATGVAQFIATAALGAFLRVKSDATYGLIVAGAEDREYGTISGKHFVTGMTGTTHAPVVLTNAQGTVRMVAAGAIAAGATVYGAAGGKIDDVQNTNPIGTALVAASGDGSVIEVLRDLGADPGVGRITFFDDFIGDYTAAGTAWLAPPWTKVETNGLGVIGSDQPNGVLKCVFDAVGEAATAALYMGNAPFDIDSNPVFECRLAIYDIGDHADLDINFGMADATHATDFSAIGVFAAFNLEGADLSVNCQSDDGTTDTAPVDSTVDLVDDTFAIFKIDMSDTSDVKFYINGARVLSGSTFDVSAASGGVTPIIHVEKDSANDTTADVRVDWIKVTCDRA